MQEREGRYKVGARCTDTGEGRAKYRPTQVLSSVQGALMQEREDPNKLGPRCTEAGEGRPKYCRFQVGAKCIDIGEGRPNY